MLCRAFLTSYKTMGCNMSLEIRFLKSCWFFSQKISAKSVITRWKISPRHYDYGKLVPRQVDLKYVGRPLLDTEEGCTWRQIPAKVISLYIFEERFCLFHEHIKYYFAHLNSSIFETLSDRKNLCTYLNSA